MGKTDQPKKHRVQILIRTTSHIYIYIYMYICICIYLTSVFRSAECSSKWFTGSLPNIYRNGHGKETNTCSSRRPERLTSELEYIFFIYIYIYIYTYTCISPLCIYIKKKTYNTVSMRLKHGKCLPTPLLMRKTPVSFSKTH